MNEPTPSSYIDDYWIWAYSRGTTGAGDQKTGKWLLFQPTTDIDRDWDLVRSAVVEGKLGQSAKVATAKPNPNTRDKDKRVICVYTVDWEDREDVGRVLRELRDMGFWQRLSYETDDATLARQYGSGVALYVSQPDRCEFDIRLNSSQAAKAAAPKSFRRREAN